MRIAVVHSFYGTASPSGENAVVDDQCTALREAGHDVELLARRTDDLQGGRGYPLRTAASVASGFGPDPGPALTAFAPDVVHVHNTFPNWGARGLLPWSARTVVTVHNFRPVCTAATLFRDGGPCTQCLRVPVLPAVQHGCYRGSRAASVPVALGTRPGGPARRVLREAAGVVVLNDEARRLYQERLRRPVHVVPNFVDGGFHAGPDRRGWVYVGRFTPEKGVVRLVEDWPDGERLDVIGAGPDVDPVHAAAAPRPGVRVLDPLPRAALTARLAGYEGLVLPSLWAEGLPTVVIEALAAGTPCIVSSAVAAGGPLEAAGAAVRYDPAGGTSSLCGAIAQVRHHGEGLRRSARDTHRATYSRDSWLTAIESLYAQVATASVG